MNKFGQVTHYSTIIAAAATITMSVAGYWSFEEKTLSNVLVSRRSSELEEGEQW